MTKKAQIQSLSFFSILVASPNKSIIIATIHK